jgi:methyl-accepting chemotaxis protein
MKIRTKLVLAVASPLVMLGVLAGGSIQKSWRRSSEMDAIQRLGRFSTTMSAMIHETQKERGATGGFLGSSDDSFKGKLKSQQDVTDERRADFDTFMADFEPSDFGPEFAAQVETAVARLNLLENKRLAVSQSSITGAESINYFMDMHASFLDCVSKSVHATSDGPIAVPR